MRARPRHVERASALAAAAHPPFLATLLTVCSTDLDLPRAVKTVADGESDFSPALCPLLLSGYLARQ